MRNVLKSLVLLFLFSAPCAPAPDKTTLHGVVTDAHEVPLPSGLKPRIFIRWDASGTNIGLKDNLGISNDISVQTDTEGRF